MSLIHSRKEDGRWGKIGVDRLQVGTKEKDHTLTPGAKQGGQGMDDTKKA